MNYPFLLKTLIRPALVCTLIGTQIACNRNALDLPAANVQSRYDTTIGIGGQLQFRLHFQKTGFAGQDSLLMYVQNLSPTNYKNLEILVELSGSPKPRYGEYIYHNVVKIPELAANGKSANILLSGDSSMLGSGVYLKTGIVNFEGNRQLMSGDYSSVYTTLHKVDSAFRDSIKRYANAEGYILADGSSHFRIASVGAAANDHYWLDGSLIDSLYFTGTLSKTDSNLAAVALDTLPGGGFFNYIDSSRTFLFRLKLLPPLKTDSVSHILFRLHKN